jgi:hypothetical protein
MGNVTKSSQNNITSPNGNSLAIFVDGVTGIIKLKDVLGNIQPLSDFINTNGIKFNDVIPALDNTYTLGNADFRWKSLHVGEGTIFITDSVTGDVAELTIADGIFFINGIAQAQLPNIKVTNLIFNDDTVQTTACPQKVNYGLFSQTEDSVPVTGTTEELSLNNGGVGSLVVPPNGFFVGDSYQATLIGNISCVGSATLDLKIKTESGVLLADTQVVNMDTATDKSWRLDISFTIRQTGVAGVASIVSGGLFSYTKNAGLNFEGSNFSIINNTTFDTTVENKLVVTAQWNTDNAGNSIYSDIFILNKTY